MTSALLDWFPRLRFFIPGFVQRSIASRLGFVEVDALVFSHQTDVAPQFAVTKGSHCKQGNGAKQQATPELRNAVVPFVFGDGPAKDGARYPEEKQRNKEAHNQSFTAL